MDLRGMERATLRPVDPAAARRQEALGVARQFEAVFVQSMVASMRASANVTGEGGGLFGDGPGADTYADWFDKNLADELSDHGRIGISETLMKEFDRWHQLDATPPDRHAPGLATALLAKGGLDVTA